ncbi:uncharacterized protein LOC128858120 [Anastrepha ludens]|uniref:uncharacterized protein LOC128858120 n=1 Tax=Anastrepha ludens TaxID=28586 RepID=UPI0023B17D99|nr:uncharacterized protein LOC128858120 [Anastrepha ludens]
MLSKPTSDNYFSMEEDIKARLQKYRVKKQREEKFAQFKKKLHCFWPLRVSADSKEEKRDSATEACGDVVEKKIQTTRVGEFVEKADYSLTFSSNEETDENIIAGENVDNNLLKYTLRVVFTSFWITLYVIAIKLQFGIVYLMLSALIGIYFNTRTTPKKRNEISAYSVFNKNCESIDGTLKAEQFEREIRFGAASIK